MKWIIKIGFLWALLISQQAFSQISPGELSTAHAHLEGISNCTKCHVLGEKETTSKCLECHTEIKSLMDDEKGYHASKEVNGKKCASCHGEHFGREFKITNFDSIQFDHQLAGYELEGKHEKIFCLSCHNEKLIKNKVSQKKGYTYLGMGTSCLSCHDDYHQKTLSSDCISCHNQEQFKPAPLFDHEKSKFPLKGKHTSVDCEKCHKISIQDNIKFQAFVNVAYSKCTDCHEDVHKNKFGNKCTECHSEESFHTIKGLNTFDHSKTNYLLEGKHQTVECAKCHKGSYTKAVKHDLCVDCHKDYHKGQFRKENIQPDCKECHSVLQFTSSSYSIEKHNLSDFILKGSHLATPCFSCHKKEENWSFRNIGNQCVDCHENVHEKTIQPKYFSEKGCANCHNESVWSDTKFDHNKTQFALTGKHIEVTCRKCHYPEKEGKTEQEFKGLKQNCYTCHSDEHNNQFASNGITDCKKCHTSKNWKIDQFDHNSTRFKLDGKHEGLECIKCHKPKLEDGTRFIEYKFEDISCASCHS